MSVSNQNIKNVICITPVYNDWESLKILLSNIENHFAGLTDKYRVSLVVVNDCSTLEMNDPSEVSGAWLRPEVLYLKNNVGHQRAIAIGLQFVASQKKDADFIVILDSDGEDKPDDIPSLLDACEKHKSKKIVFARRKKRRETLLFRTGYAFYKFVFYLLTGQRISFGNFSCVPSQLLQRVIILENLWNHYSGSILQAKIPYDTVHLDRGKRYCGKSKMNSTALVLHGLSSISVYFDLLSVRILKLSLCGMVACTIAVCIVLYFKLFTNEAIPGWASNLILIIFSIIIQLSSVTLIVLLMQLSSRKNVKVPGTDLYKNFISNII
jgi:polyisoprenyl-phosphate glycosyltransferase